MKRIVAICLAVVFVTACQTMPDENDSPTPDYPVVDRTGEGRECAAEQFQVLVGQRASEVHTDSLPYPHRVYAHGDPVTMDYRPDRLNVVTDARGVVISVACG
jgi:hypothetical protein